MANGVALIEIHNEQGELIHRFTITKDDIQEHGPYNLVQSAIDTLPIEQAINSSSVAYSL